MSEHRPAAEAGCDGCPLADARVARREFLQSGAVLAALAAVGALAPTVLPLRVARALVVRGDERAYPIPSADGATIDRDESVIILRWKGAAYAFSLACPHQRTMLHWEQDNARFQCPKHHSKFEPDGTFIEGRATRALDRFALRRDGDRLIVDLDRMYRQDEDPALWRSAVVQL